MLMNDGRPPQGWIFSFIDQGQIEGKQIYMKSTVCTGAYSPFFLKISIVWQYFQVLD